MLLQVVSFGLVLVGIILLGVKLGLEIKDLEVQVFFWVLYGVSILTFFMSLLCVYIYVTFRKKTGPLGPQGFQGEPGEEGDPGNCDQNLCRGRTLAIMLEKLIEKYNKKPVSTDLKKKICGYITLTDKDTNDTTKVGTILKNWNLLDVKTYHDIFQQQLSYLDGEVDGDNLLTVINGAKAKFNGYTSDMDKHLPDANFVPSNIC